LHVATKPGRLRAVARLVTGGWRLQGLREALIAGQIQDRPAFLEVYLNQNQLFHRPVSADENAGEEKAAGVLLFSN